MALNNVPLSGQTLNDTRVPINQNFSVIDTAFSIDHVDYNAGGQGKHAKVTLPVQAGAPAFAGTDNGFFNLLYATSTKQEIYVHKQSGAGTANIPFTASTLSANAAPASNAGMWTFLPSGLLLKSGSSIDLAGGLIQVTPTGGPNFTQILSVIIGAYSNTSTGDLNFAVRLVDINSANTFRVYISSRTSTGAAPGGFQFLAIGY